WRPRGHVVYRAPLRWSRGHSPSKTHTPPLETDRSGACPARESRTRSSAEGVAEQPDEDRAMTETETTAETPAEAPPIAETPAPTSAALMEDAHPARSGELPIGLRALIDAGVHFGHQTRRWNPKMRQYIFG